MDDFGARHAPGGSRPRSEQVPEPSRHYAMAARLPAPLAPGAGGLLVQYEVQITESHGCGGAYLKLLSHEEGRPPGRLGRKTHYSIMFGPDRCGAASRVRAPRAPHGPMRPHAPAARPPRSACAAPGACGRGMACSAGACSGRQRACASSEARMRAVTHPPFPPPPCYSHHPSTPPPRPQVHVIIKLANPATGQITEHHLSQPPLPPNDKLPHVYTLVLDPAADRCRVRQRAGQGGRGDTKTEVGVGLCGGVTRPPPLRSNLPRAGKGDTQPWALRRSWQTASGCWLACLAPCPASCPAAAEPHPTRRRRAGCSPPPDPTACGCSSTASRRQAAP